MTQAKSDLKTEKNKKIRSEELVKEFEDFRNTNKPSQQNVGWESSEIVMNRNVRNDSVLEEKIIDELQKLVTTDVVFVFEINNFKINRSENNFSCSS